MLNFSVVELENALDSERRTMMQIRCAKIEDAKEVCVICVNDLGYECNDELVKEQLALLDQSREEVFVAEEQGRILGFIHVELYRTIYSETLANILGLAVAKSARRTGVGRTLIEASEEWAKNHGVYGVRLNSSMARKNAHEFYRALGYDLEKEQIRFLKLFNKE